MSHKKSLGSRSPQNHAPLSPQASPAGVVGQAPVTPGLDHTIILHHRPPEAMPSTPPTKIPLDRKDLPQQTFRPGTRQVRGRQIVPVKAQTVNMLGFEFHILCPSQIVHPAVASKGQPETTWVDECGHVAASLHFQKQTMGADTCSPLQPGLPHSLCSASRKHSHSTALPTCLPARQSSTPACLLVDTFHGPSR